MADDHLSGEQLVGLAVDDLDGSARSPLLQHLSVCGRCRSDYDVLASAAEQALAAAPALEPPPGFDSRVLAALGVDPPSRHAPARSPARWRTAAPARWRLLAAAAAVGAALGAGGVGIWALSDDAAPAAASTSFLTTGDGDEVGTVTRTLLQGEPALLITVSDGPVGMEYLCALRLEDGRRVEVAVWPIVSEGNQSWVVPVSGDVAEVVLVADAGAGPVWSSATV